MCANTLAVPVSRSARRPRRLGALLGCALIAPAGLAQSFSPLHGLPGTPTVGAFDPHRQRPIVATSGMTGQTDLWEWSGAGWQRRAGEAQLPLLDPMLVTDTLRGRVLAFGQPTAGSGGYGGYAFDGVRWQPLPGGSPFPRALLAFDSARDRVLAYSYNPYPLSSSLLAWNGTAWTQVHVSNWPPFRGGAAFAFDPVRGRTVLFGGYDALLGLLGDTWEWDGNVWTQFGGAGPAPRLDAAMAFDATAAKLVMFGGANTLPLVDTWTFDGVQWTQLAAAPAPAPETRLAAVMIPHGGGVTMVGGRGLWNRSDTWLHTSGAWVPLQGDQGPPQRAKAVMAFDSVRGETVLYGGWFDMYSGFAYSDTWTFDGTWHQRQPANNPGWRIGAHLDFDGARSEAVLFGGLTLTGLNIAASADTWIWNGSNWVQRTPAAQPPPRSLHQLVYDRLRQRIVLFGGTDGVNDLADTWLWDGSNWQAATSVVTPAARSRHFMAFDQAQGNSVLFGGVNVNGGVRDTWLWDGVHWQQAAPTLVPGQVILCAYDAGRGRVVAADRTTDWSWTGTDWVTTPVGLPVPPVRSGDNDGPATAYDERLQRVLVLPAFDEAGTDRLYAYGPTPAAAITFGNGCAPAGAPVPDLFAIGRPALREASFAFGLRADAAARPMVLAVGLRQQQTPIGGGCDALVDLVVGAFFVLSGNGGFVDLHAPVPDLPALRGLQLYGQGFALLPGGLAATRGSGLRFGD